MDHAGIVPVYDVGQAAGLGLYIVSKLIDGQNLADRLRDRPLDLPESVQIVIQVARSLDAAHRRGLVHRDIKPSNILLDEEGAAYVTDFGLAVREDDPVDDGKFAGTPAYMSPEQARGEGHLVDGRADIFSLGIVLYELLTGVRPFTGATVKDLLYRIANSEVRPPRQREPNIPPGLERVCLKALANRATDRYSTAADLADELQRFLDESLSDAHSNLLATRAVADSDGASTADSVVPKGLRSFDADDAEFFLQLVPGPIDRSGLPESVRFWKQRLDRRDPLATFRVGVIYGPSGSGKSSFVKAGILPRLDQSTRTVYCEAVAHRTTERVLTALKRTPSWPSDAATAAEGLVQIRRGLSSGHGGKLLIVIDQLEQAFQEATSDELQQLTCVLRQCDGAHVQALLIVRDDFWLPLVRCMQSVEEPRSEGENCRLIDLFDRRHAARVLEQFGRAYGCLPPDPQPLDDAQGSFLEAAVDQLQDNEKVIAIRLAVFAEMMKGRPWNVAALVQVGGAEGIGLRFLDEMLGRQSSSPESRRHYAAATRVLSTLVPAVGSVRGEPRRRRDLLEASGYIDRPDDFDALLRIVNHQLRIVTTIDADDESPRSGELLFQLAHDFLIPSLRDWLRREQRSTPAGRAAILLEERAAVWNAQPQARNLPTAMETLWIATRIPRRTCARTEARMMRQAGRRIARRVVAGFLLVAVVLAAASFAHERVRAQRGHDLANGLLSCELPRVAVYQTQLLPYRDLIPPTLAAVPASDRAQHLRATLGLHYLGVPQRNALLTYLLESRNSTELIAITDALTGETPEPILVRLWPVARDTTQSADSRFFAAAAIVTLDPAGEYGNRARLSAPWSDIAPLLARELVAHAAIEDDSQASWGRRFKPIRIHLRDPLREISHDSERPAHERWLAARLSAQYAADDPSFLVQSLVAARGEFFSIFFDTIKSANRSSIRDELIRQLHQGPSVDEQALAATALVKLSSPEEVWPSFRVAEDPTLRTSLIHRLAHHDADPGILIGELERQTDPGILSAILQALGEFNEQQLTPAAREALAPRLLGWYRTRPEIELHGATEWLLRQWQHDSEIRRIDEELATPFQPHESRAWFVNRVGQTFVVLQAEALLIGSPNSDPARGESEVQHLHRINRRLAVATKEIDRQLFAEYYREIGVQFELQDAARDWPRNGINWFQAAAFCNWLSHKDGIPSHEWCYTRNQGQYDEMQEGFLEKQGYRLPTDAEWEFACRAGTTTPRYFGSDSIWLDKYAWCEGRTQTTQPVGMLKPNAFGLFDMHGNVWEWCTTKWQLYRPQDTDDNVPAARIGPHDQMNLRGGAFASSAPHVRSSWINYEDATQKRPLFGFRVVRTIPTNRVTKGTNREGEAPGSQVGRSAQRGEGSRSKPIWVLILKQLVMGRFLNLPNCIGRFRRFRSQMREWTEVAWWGTRWREIGRCVQKTGRGA